MDVKRGARVWILGSLAISLALLLLGAGPRAAFASDGQRPPNARVDLTGPSNGDPDEPTGSAPGKLPIDQHGIARPMRFSVATKQIPNTRLSAADFGKLFSDLLFLELALISK